MFLNLISSFFHCYKDVNTSLVGYSCFLVFLMSVITALAWAQRRKCNKFTDILWPSWIINKERCSRDVFLFIIRAKSLSLLVNKQITDHFPCICILLISFAQNVLDRNPSASTDKRHCLTWSVSTNLDHCWTKVVTIDNSSPLFATVRDCSPLFGFYRHTSFGSISGEFGQAWLCLRGATKRYRYDN